MKYWKKNHKTKYLQKTEENTKPEDPKSKQ
jgi:hypothetical protein